MQIGGSKREEDDFELVGGAIWALLPALLVWAGIFAAVWKIGAMFGLG